MTKPYPNEALTDICKQLMDDWGLTGGQIINLSKDIPGECEAIMEDRWQRQQESLMESGGPDDSAYRRDMKNAGRGHLLR